MLSSKLTHALVLVALFTTQAAAEVTVYRCVPTPGHPCPSRIEIRRPAPAPYEAPAPDTHLDGRVAALEAGADRVRFRVSLVGGLTLDDDTDFLGNLGVGISKEFSSGFADLDLLFGGTETSSGVVLGLRGDYLFTIAEMFRAGPGLAANFNYGASRSDFGPDLTVEAGPKVVSGFLRLAMPYVVADENGNTGWVNPTLTLGAVGRF